MKFAVISDIHANAVALRTILSDAGKAGVERVICLGDIVGYGPQPRETLALVRKYASVVVAGNHDDAVAGRQSADGFIDLAGEAVSRHRAALSREEIAYLRGLAYEGEFGGARVAHGDFTDPKAFRYVENEADAEANFKATDAALMFVGHTHTPGIFVVGESGNVHRLEPQDFVMEAGKRYLVNPGSVGYPRATNGECFSSYVIYDSEARTIAFRLLPFSVNSVMQRGKSARHRWVWPLVALAALGIVVGGAIFYRATQPTRVKLVRLEVPATENSSLIVEKRSLTLTKDMKVVRANLKLDQKHDPAMLHTEFRSAEGKTLKEYRQTVMKSHRKAIKIPKGAVSVHFTLLKLKPADTPRPTEFKPSAERR